MEIKQITKNSYYIPGHTNIGIYVENDKVVLIDSGSDKSVGRKIIKLFEEKRWELSKIINTHSNADHIGGNAYLQKKTGCDIFATSVEANWIQITYLEPFLLWGAHPFQALRNKFLQAEPSQVTKIINSKGLIADTSLQSFPLEGHFLQMIGIKTPDDIFFIADSLFSKEIIDKYKITFRTNIEKSLQTYTFLEKENAQLFIPSHAEPTGNLNSLIQVNRKQIKEINQKILKYCHRPVTREEIIACLVGDYHLQLSAVQYVLLNTSTAAHISYLNENQLLDFKFIENKMCWEVTNKDK